MDGVRGRGASGTSAGLARHRGREYGVVQRGELEVTVGPEVHLLGPGDSISFESTEPHMLRNPGPARADVIWVVVGKRSGGSSDPGFDRTD